MVLCDALVSLSAIDETKNNMSAHSCFYSKVNPSLIWAIIY